MTRESAERRDSLEAAILDGAAPTPAGEEGDETPASVLADIAQGRRPAEALAELWNRELHLRTARLEPPKLDLRLRGKARGQAVHELNLEAGGRERPPSKPGHVLEKLAALPSHLAIVPISRLDDPATLWCLVRSGRIAERRAAVRRLGHLIRQGSLEEGDLDARDIVDGLAAMRDPRIAFEIDMALASIPGAAGRAARQRRTRVDRLLNRVTAEAAEFWAGEREGDPLEKLSREESLRLGVWLRRANDDLASHVAERLRFLLSNAEDSALADTIGALIPCGDERLVPALAQVLADGALIARIAAARAMGRIADPRVRSSLKKAYKHAEDDMERIVLGGALGQCGDARATDVLLSLLDSNDPALLEEIVRSLGSIGATRAAPAIAPLLDSDRSPLVRAAAQALIRCGTPAELKILRRHAARPSHHANLLSDAAEAMALRLQILNQLDETDEPPPMMLAAPRRDRSVLADETVQPDLRQRLLSFGYLALGLLWSALWQRPRALAAFDAAARIYPRNAAAHLRVAALQSAMSRDDLAIVSYRRALRANRRLVLLRPAAIQKLMRTYLRRADALVARRRRRQALELLDELAALDLRNADLDLRLAVTRRRDRLLVDLGRPREGGR